MRIKVRNLARIREAEVEVKPLTIFVGKNGTNKSYMAHVVYGVYSVLDNIEAILDMKFRKILDERFSSIEKIGDLFYFFDNLDSFITNIYELLENFVKEVSATDAVKEVFNLEESSLLKNLDVSFSYQDVLFKLRIKDISNNMKKRFVERVIPFIIDNEELGGLKFLKRKLKFDILRFLEAYFIRRFKGLDKYYFPASRTGFVLAFDDIVAGIFRERFGGKATTRLTKPVIDFLSNFADIKADRFEDWDFDDDVEVLNRVIRFLNHKILKGEVIENKEEEKYKKFYFQPFDSEILLSPYLSSSGVIELLPIVEFLKNFGSLKNKLLIIEEPEAHLHPQAQIEMARFLVLLVNNGANVLVTTHSDYIMDEINNCIKLFGIEEKKRNLLLKKYGLAEYPDIAISPEKVGVYLFKEVNEKVEVKPLRMDKYGILDESFKEVSEELFERSVELEEELDE